MVDPGKYAHSQTVCTEVGKQKPSIDVRWAGIISDEMISQSLSVAADLGLLVHDLSKQGWWWYMAVAKKEVPCNETETQQNERVPGKDHGAPKSGVDNLVDLQNSRFRSIYQAAVLVAVWVEAKGAGLTNKPPKECGCATLPILFQNI